MISKLNLLTNVNFPAENLTRFVHIENLQKIFICDYDDQNIKIIDLNGNFLGSYNPNSILAAPYCLTCNNRNEIYVADHFRRKIFVFNSKMKYKKEFGNDELKMPSDMTIDNRKELLYVADYLIYPLILLII